VRQIIAEIHRRSVWQVLGVYLVGSWFGYEVVLALTEGVGLPVWVPAFAIVLFIIGPPVVLANAGRALTPSRGGRQGLPDSAVAMHMRCV
jgi:hypothetical protein